MLALLQYLRYAVPGKQLLSEETEINDPHPGRVGQTQDFSESLISIIIPTRDRPELLDDCLAAVFDQNEFTNFEVILVNNRSVMEETAEIIKKYSTRGMIVLDYDAAFNYAEMMNLAATRASGTFLFLLNNDAIPVRSPWLRPLLEHMSANPDLGVVGTVQKDKSGELSHLGIHVGPGGFAKQLHPRNSRVTPSLCRRVNAVTFSAALIRRRVFDELDGLDDKLKVGLNDVDFCVRAALNGFSVEICKNSEFTHKLGATRGSVFMLRNFFQAVKEIQYFERKLRP